MNCHVGIFPGTMELCAPYKIDKYVMMVIVEKKKRTRKRGGRAAIRLNSIPPYGISTYYLYASSNFV